MFNENQITLDMWDERELPKKLIVFKDIIIDRKSKYTIVGWYVENYEEVGEFLKYLKKDKYFRDATHNSFAYRIKQENGSILEWKNDDGETWAWMCILREIQRENWINMVLVVTRYFGWIKLQTDRFKNVIDACKMFFEEVKK
jgi:putative IMPACT (imprinted ancient) family translation regulator